MSDVPNYAEESRIINIVNTIRIACSLYAQSGTKINKSVLSVGHTESFLEWDKELEMTQDKREEVAGVRM